MAPKEKFPRRVVLKLVSDESLEHLSSYSYTVQHQAFLLSVAKWLKSFFTTIDVLTGTNIMVMVIVFIYRIFYLHIQMQ